MPKIIFVSAENFLPTLSSQIPTRKEIFFVVWLKRNNDGIIEQMCQLLAKNHKFVRTTYNHSRKTNFYHDIAGQLKISLFNDQGQALNTNELREAINNSIDERNIFFFPEGSRLFELSSLNSWLNDLIGQGALLITSEYKSINKVLSFLYIHIRSNCDEDKEDLEIVFIETEVNKKTESLVRSFLYPRKLLGAIEKNTMKSPPMLALFFGVGLMISLLPPFGSALNGIVLYVIASCALVWLIVWR